MRATSELAVNEVGGSGKRENERCQNIVTIEQQHQIHGQSMHRRMNDTTFAAVKMRLVTSLSGVSHEGRFSFSSLIAQLPLLKPK